MNHKDVVLVAAVAAAAAAADSYIVRLRAYHMIRLLDYNNSCGIVRRDLFH